MNINQIINQTSSICKRTLDNVNQSPSKCNKREKKSYDFLTTGQIETKFSQYISTAHMTKLFLSVSAIAEDKLASILSRMPMLRDLSLLGCTNVTGSVIKSIKLNELRSFNIGHCDRFEPNHMIQFLALSGAKLRDLRFGSRLFTNITPFDIGIITAHHCTQLKRIHIDIYKCSQFECEFESTMLQNVLIQAEDGANVDIFANQLATRNPRLRYFYIDNAESITVETVIALSKLYLLETLVLLKNKFSINTVRYFDSKPNLRVLMLDAQPNCIISLYSTALFMAKANLAVLSLLNHNVTKWQFERIISKCTNLVRLAVSSDCIELLEVNKCNKLEHLTLNGFSQLTNLDIISTSLTKLQIENSQVQRICLLSPALSSFDITRCNNIRCILIKSNNSMKEFTISSQPTLSDLYLECTVLKKLYVSECRNLRFLRISSCDQIVNLNAFDLPLLSKLEILSNNLETIDLHNCCELKSLIVRGQCQPRVINFSHCNLIPDRNLYSILKYRVSRLEVLDISYMNDDISYNTLNMLPNLRSINVLKMNGLDLVDNHLVRSLSVSKYLTILEIKGCDQVTPSTMIKLIEDGHVPSLLKLNSIDCRKNN